MTKDRGSKMVGLPPVTETEGMTCNIAINMK
jgi:hypothetical protein